MGLTTASLHFFDVDREAIAPLLPHDTVLRDHNAPWLDLLLPEDFGPEAFTDLEKLGKRVTKSGVAEYALLFLYHDEDMFRCVLFKGGKKAASCDSDGSWAKLGKALDLLFGDGVAPKAFRYVSHCFDLVEKVRLLEETVGTALLDCAESEPRNVKRSDDTLKAIKARESALRKRPNQYTMTEIPVEEWPVDLQAQLRLYQFLRTDWYQHHASSLLYGFGDAVYSIPQRTEYAVFTDAFGPAEYFWRCKADGKEPEKVLTPANVSRVLWQTPQDEPVVLYAERLTRHGTDTNWLETANGFVVACLKPDGTPRWRFVPPNNEIYVGFIHTDDQGAITLFTPYRWDKDRGIAAHICRIDGMTGELLYDRDLPEEYAEKLQRVEALNGFVYSADRKELVVLNDELEEVARWPQPANNPLESGSLRGEENPVGPILWGQGLYSRKLWRRDLRNGAATETKPEIPCYIYAVLPDGRFLGGNEDSRFTVFDPDGTVISRHKMKGFYRSLRVEGDRVYVLETRSPNMGPLVCDELFEKTSYHLWRLDRVSTS